MPETVRTVRPIVNEGTGVIVVPQDSVGTILSYLLEDGSPGDIPRPRQAGFQAGRDLVYTVRFVINAVNVDVKIRCPIDFEFTNGDIGLLTTLMVGQTVTGVDFSFYASPTFPTMFPTLLRLRLGSGINIRLQSDRVSGTIKTELDALETGT